MKFDHSYKPYSIYNHNEHSKIIILCDHASKTIPKKYKNLGLSQKNVNKHIGWDIGALKLAKKISKRTNSTLIYSGYSRLLVDCNRALQTKGAFIKKSEDVIIPGNLEINRAEKILRAKKYYFPYHNKIKSILNKKLRKKIVPIFVSIHSFTPVYLKKIRPWHIGLLYLDDKRLTSFFGLSDSKNNSWADTIEATVSLIGPVKNIIRSLRSLLKVSYERSPLDVCSMTIGTNEFSIL